MPQKLRILIAGASARAAAFSALRAGFEVQAVDLFADLDLRRRCQAARVVNYPDGLEKHLEQLVQDRSLSNGSAAWMFTGALENYPDLVDRVVKYIPLLGTVGPALREVRDPFHLGEVVRGAGFRFPETLLVASDQGPSPLASHAQASIAQSSPPSSTSKSWLWKPFHSSGGQQIRERSDSKTSDKELAKRSPGQTEKLELGYYQEKIAGASVAAIFLASGGETSNRKADLLGVTQQLLGPDWSASHRFAYAGSVGPLVLNDQQTDDLNRLGETLCQRFDLRGLFGVDMIIKDETFWPLEVNPRYTASVEILERAFDIQAIALHVAACQTSKTESAPALPRGVQPASEHVTTCGKAILFASGDLVVPTEFESYAIGLLDTRWPEIADVPAAGTKIEAGQPITTLFATGPDIVSVQDALREKMNDLERRFFV